eukprot:TRINITY_DN16322_c0_g1_i1.p1 TRINITY_DN16322_c0_g1~~TRINITY_DN16322_c0_g1_i1.p1  ORF type:complete len:428 (+),score=147.16 TRINITY_DN16322_c0_g1_i1:56-1285(+)
MPPKRDTTQVIGANYESINYMAVDSRNEQRYRSSLFGKTKEQNLDQCGNKRMENMVKKAVKKEKAAGGGATRTKTGGMMGDLSDDTDEDDGAPAAPSGSKRSRVNAEDPGAKKVKAAHNPKPQAAPQAPLDADLLARSVHLSLLPAETQEDDLRAAFAAIPGIASADVKVFRRGQRCRGGGVIAFAGSADAAQALALGASGVTVRGIAIKVEPRSAQRASPSKPAAPQTQWVDEAKISTDDPTLARTLYISGVAHGTTKEALQEFFEKLAPLDNVALTQKRNAALVEFATEEGALKGLKVTGSVINNKEVTIARSKLGFATYAASKTVHKGWQGAKKDTPASAPVASGPPSTAAAPAAAPGAAPVPAETEDVAMEDAALAAENEVKPEAPKPKPKIKSTIFSFKPRTVK